jgi:peroxiredoxin
MKKSYILIKILLLICLNTSFSQHNYFKVVGKINGMNHGEISLFVPKSDSTFNVENNKYKIKNGIFEFSGKIQYPRSTRLIFRDSTTYYSDWFYLENSLQEIEVNLINNSLVVESNSEVFKEERRTFAKFNDSIYLIKTRCYDVLDSLKGVEDKKYKEDSINSILTNLASITDTYLRNQILKNNSSYIALFELYHSISFGKQEYFSYYEMFSPELKESELGAKVKNRLLKYNYLRKGSLFPVFKLLDTNFNLQTLNVKNQAKFTLIDFWFSSCGTCVRQFPALKDLYSKYKNVGFQLIGISTELKKYQDEWKNGIYKYQIPWPQFWDVDHIQTSEYGIKFFPTNFLLDSHGTILARNIELDALLDFLDKNLNQD